ncbi:hypothetical protein OG230_20700 [Streptomyces sp. NBC_00234]|uniref:hypothetical protein n=1 Tax=Streptomyces sp. NBC_00234 TaxID=2903638 RepID=UPI002E2C092C|nr:hypothetical protein [Streptomyces sp. NBC_00234]
MRPVPTRRAVHLGTCAVAAGVLLMAGQAAPAVAAAQSDTLWINAPSEQSLPLGTAGGAPEERRLDIGLTHDNENYTVTDGRLTVDITGIAGIAEVTWPENCAPSGTTAVCSVPEVPVGWGDYTPQVHLTVRAADGAVAGAQGRIVYSAVATGPAGEMRAPLDSFDTTLSVASGPDLALGGLAPVTGTVPGAVHDVPLTVTNKGNERSDGFSLRMSASYGLGFAARHPECTYRETAGDYAPMTHVDCAFGEAIEPGETFTLPGGLDLALAAYAMNERLDVTVEPGAGATDLSGEDNYGIVAFEAAGTADFAVRGARVEGAAGDTVDAALTFRNKGPAWVGNLGSGDSVAVVDFTVPQGVTVTGAPEGCEARTLAGAYHPQHLGAPRYSCAMPYWVSESAKRSFAFQLRIDEVVPDAEGRLYLRPESPGLPAFPFDPNTRNNTAKVVVNATPEA